MILCCSCEANCLDEAFGRKEELKLTTFKGLMLMCFFLMSLLELNNFRTSKKKKKNQLCLDSIIVWELRGYRIPLKCACSHHFEACFNTHSCLSGCQCPFPGIAFPAILTEVPWMATLNRMLALFVLISLNCVALGLTHYQPLEARRFQREGFRHIPPEGHSVDCTILCRLPTFPDH